MQNPIRIRSRWSPLRYHLDEGAANFSVHRVTVEGMLGQALKEINELRYVLCPKRMTDEEFWKVYFTLSKRHLPEEAWDPNFVVPAAPPAPAAVPVLPFNVTGLQKSLTEVNTPSIPTPLGLAQRYKSAHMLLRVSLPHCTVHAQIAWM
jgi:hypothetical protein